MAGREKRMITKASDEIYIYIYIYIYIRSKQQAASSKKQEAISKKQEEEEGGLLHLAVLGPFLPSILSMVLK
jgi:Ca2+/Na+ antiporter